MGGIDEAAGHPRPDGAGRGPLGGIVAFLLATALSCSLPAGVLAGCSGEQAAQQVDPTQMVEDTTGAQDASQQAGTRSGDADGKQEGKRPAKKADGQQGARMKAAGKAAEAAVEGHEGVAVAVLPLDGSKGFDIRGDRRFVSASMIKLLILAEFMAQVDAGDIRLEDTHVLDGSEIVGGTGHIAELGAGAEYTNDELAEYMVCYSDNTATNILIDELGMDAINARARALGLENTDLQRKMMDLGSGVENHMSANDAATILRGIASHDIASGKMCKRAERYLKAQTDDDGLAQGVPGSVEFGHKTGTLDQNRHDGGIVYADEPFVLVFFSTGSGMEATNELMADTARAVCGELL